MPQDTTTTIRITEADANSDHVESLLRRQMSLRGERGITAVKKRRWWLQNWFILMVVAGAAAFAAWTIIEPYYDDEVYFQGTIENANLSQSYSNAVSNGAPRLTLEPVGWIRIRDQSIWLIDQTKFFSDGKAQPFDREKLKIGQEVGVYLSYIPTENEPVVLAHYIDPSPKPQSASREKLKVVNLVFQREAAERLLFPLVAGLVGLALGAADGIVCRMPRRALLSGAIGLLVGVLGGFVSGFLAELAYAPLSRLATGQSHGNGLTGFALFVQITGRGIAWLLAGMAMGLGQGIALRSKRLLLYGFLGGIVGGLMGGLLFDPVYFFISGKDTPSGHISRMVGITVVGLFVGAMIGIVEVLARDAWLRMTEGPLAGKEFLLFKDVMRIGSSSRSDLYLFNDPQVAEAHAQIRTTGDNSEIQSEGPDKLVLVNGRPTRNTRLRHGDQITIGRTSFLFQSRKG